MIGRRAFTGLAGGALTAWAQPHNRGEAPGRIAPANELVNAFEFEAMARRRLDASAFAEVGGGDRSGFERITFRQRLMVNSLALDLTTELLGEKLFAPILAGPVAGLKRYHPEAERAWVRGAEAAKTLTVIPDRASLPLREIEAAAPRWFQIAAPGGSDAAAVRARIDAAVSGGCKAVMVTAPVNWSALDSLRKGLTAPILVKGIMSPEDARAAVERGVQGLVVSSYRDRAVVGASTPVEMLPAITEAVAGRVPVLIDGGFRRGSDVLKALALGARAVLIARPLVWGLAAYGAPGVQQVLELIQSELARDMAMTGRVTIAQIDKTLVRIHRR